VPVHLSSANSNDWLSSIFAVRAVLLSVNCCSGRTLPQHRKTAVSFRDLALLDIFAVALDSMQKLRAGEVRCASTKQVKKATNCTDSSQHCSIISTQMHRGDVISKHSQLRAQSMLAIATCTKAAYGSLACQ
jgi:hypothetical protein